MFKKMDWSLRNNVLQVIQKEKGPKWRKNSVSQGLTRLSRQGASEQDVSGEVGRTL